MHTPTPTHVIVAVLVTVVSVLLIQKPIMRATNLVVFYWLGMVVLGPYITELSVSYFLSYPEQTNRVLLYYMLGFMFFAIGIACAQIPQRLRQRRSPSLSDTFMTVAGRTPHYRLRPWVFFGFSFVGLACIWSTWAVVGTIPLLSGATAISKYFVDVSTDFVRMRPFYTLGLFISVTMMTILLVSALQGKLNLALTVLALLILVTLVLTAKRAQVLFPFLYAALTYANMRQAVLRSGVALLIMIVVALALGSAGVEHTINYYSRILAHSFFVGVRALGVLLEHFNGDLYYGKTYLAGIMSFIPTEFSEFKAQYYFGRVTRHILGHDPNHAGGIRASFIGEAYINFGIFGIALVSLIYGIATAYTDDSFRNSRLLLNYGYVGVGFYYFVLHRFFVGFLEDGTNVILHAAIPVVIYLLVLRLGFIVERHSATQ